MSKFLKVFFRIYAAICICLIVSVSLVFSGVIKSPWGLNDDNEPKQEQTSSNTDTSSNQNNNKNNDIVDVNQVPSVLTINLSGTYLDAFNNAVKTVDKSDTKSQILLKVGLQILQSKTINYENELHFYSLSYTNSASEKAATKYDLKDTINRINAKQYIYTDCFGFVRLAHSIACYTINSGSPSSVSGLSGLYGYKGAYSEGKTFDSMSKLKSGAVIYDCLTGSGSGNRHVAMYLYTDGNNVVLMDQSGIRTGSFYTSEKYIYSEKSSNPYKFNKYKNYC